jgi:hypothetical protein
LTFNPPSELEFIERGFGFSPLHDPDEAVVSYQRAYPGDRTLMLTFSAGSAPSLSIVLSQSSIPLSVMTLEYVNSFSFQAWHGERIFRIGFEREFGGIDLRVHYDPTPSVHLASFASGS